MDGIDKIIDLIQAHPNYHITLYFGKPSEDIVVRVLHRKEKSVPGVQTDSTTSQFKAGSTLGVTVRIPKVCLDQSVDPVDMLYAEIEWAVEEVSQARQV